MKRLVTYSIEDEATRLALEARIEEIDPDNVTIVDEHSMIFNSDLNLEDLSKIPIELAIDGGDDVYFFEITGQADGFGISRGEIKEFMKS